MMIRSLLCWDSYAMTPALMTVTTQGARGAIDQHLTGTFRFLRRIVT